MKISEVRQDVKRTTNKSPVFEGREGGGTKERPSRGSSQLCHALLPRLVLPLIGMAASSLLMQRYSPSTAMMATLTRLVSHQAHEWGKPV